MNFLPYLHYVAGALVVGLVVYFVAFRWKHRTLDTMKLLPGEEVLRPLVPIGYAHEPASAPGSTRATYFHAGTSPALMRVTTHRILIARKGFGGSPVILFAVYRDDVHPDAGSLLDDGYSSCAAYAGDLKEEAKGAKTRIEFALHGRGGERAAAVRMWIETDQPDTVRAFFARAPEAAPAA